MYSDLYECRVMLTVLESYDVFCTDVLDLGEVVCVFMSALMLHCSRENSVLL